MGMISDSNLPANEKEELINFVKNRQHSDDYSFGISIKARKWANRYNEMYQYDDRRDDIIKSIAIAYSFGYAHALDITPGEVCFNELKDTLEKKISMKETLLKKKEEEELFYKIITNNPYINVDYNDWNM